MDLILRVALIGLFIVAGVLLFSPYEFGLESVIAALMVSAVLAGFLIQPRTEVFYVQTAVRTAGPGRDKILEKDCVAVQVELVRLWLLFFPTLLAVAFLAVAAAGRTFSVLNWVFSGNYGLVVLWICELPAFGVLLLLSAWISERWVLRNAEACSARSFSKAGRWVSYLFMGEQGEYYGGHCAYWGLVQPLELSTIVFHNTKNPEVNKIAMGFLFHGVRVLAHGVTELDNDTVAAQSVLSESAP